MNRARRTLIAALAGAGCLTLLLHGCASLWGPRTVEISRDELLRKLGQRFPTTQRVMGVLDVEAASPTLTLQPEHNRVMTGIALTARDLLRGGTYQGDIQLSFGLRYEPQDLSLRLTQLKVERMSFPGLPAAYERALTRLGAGLAESTLQDYTVHRFKPEDLRRADRLGYEVGEIAVTATGLAVQLRPRPDAPKGN